MVARITRPLIAIVGPTAGGKSDLAIDVAQRYNCEIISADSWLVRKYLDVGTAKPTPEQMKIVPHHMIDIVNPCDDYSAARYKREALMAVESTYSRSKVPLVVGGTGLYVDSLLYDYSFLPAPASKIREELNSMDLKSLKALALSKGLDIASIDINNKRRVIRLIETNGMVATRDKLRPGTLIIGIDIERKDLKTRISNRVDHMLATGLLTEVQQLADEYSWECEALKGIGYSEWYLFFNGKQSIETTRERIIKDTYELAKRQETWFKRNKSIHWITTPVNPTILDELVTTFLSKHISL